MLTFGEKLKELRETTAMTQASLADASGVPIGTIRDFEQGKRNPLSSTAQKLARALGRGLDVFNDVEPGKHVRAVRRSYGAKTIEKKKHDRAKKLKRLQAEINRAMGLQGNIDAAANNERR